MVVYAALVSVLEAIVCGVVFVITNVKTAKDVMILLKSKFKKRV